MSAADAPRSFNSVVLPHAVDPGSEYPVRMLKYLCFEVAGVKGGRFLDLGGGWGAYTRIALDLGFDAISIDREPAAEGVPYRICDLKHDEIPIDSNSIDIVFSKSVIEHFYLHEVPHLMAEILRVLKPGGALLLMTPDWESNTKGFYRVFTHVTPYTRTSLAQCLKRYGFQGISCEKFVQLPSVWHSAFAKLMATLTYYAPLPKGLSKWVRWSKELSLVGVGYK